jgi:hypothetical protein
MLWSGFSGKGRIVLLSIALATAFFPVFYKFFELLSHKREDTPEEPDNKTGNKIRNKHIYMICWLVIFLSWIPVFLAYYPAVMAYDFNIQSLQASWGPPYFSTHHPIVHTLLIWVCFEIGEAVGSLQTGMAVYSIFQMLVLSAALSYAVTFVYRLSKKIWPAAVTLLFFAIFPYNSILSISVTKDVIFAALFLVFILLILERMLFMQKKNKIFLNVVTFLDGFAMLLFRNNAIYAFVVFAVIYVATSKGRERLRVFILCLAICLSGELALQGLLKYCAYFGKGSSAEMYSVPMQQFARVGYYHGYIEGNNLDEDTYEMIDKYVSHEAWENYNASIADSIKIYVSAFQFSDWRDDYAAMWKTWAAVGKKYPNEYIDAFLSLTSGYWFLNDVSWAENLGYGLEDRKGALFTFNASVSEAQPDGIPNESKFPALENALEEVISNNCFYKWPVLFYLFEPALYCWTLVICALGFMYQKRKNLLVLTMLPLLYLGTLMLGPVVIVRYVFPIIVLSPVLITLLFTKYKNFS